MRGIGEGADPDESLVGPEREDRLVQVGIGERGRCIVAIAKQDRRAEHAVALVDADVEIGRADEAFDGPELQPFDLPGDRPELALRIDLDLDASAAALLDLLLVDLDVFVLRLVDGRGAEFHREGLRVQRGREAKREPDGGGRQRQL
jgi:hypothetical protein